MTDVSEVSLLPAQTECVQNVLSCYGVGQLPPNVVFVHDDDKVMMGCASSCAELWKGL